MADLVKTQQKQILCFDRIDEWAPVLSEILLPLAPADIQLRLKESAPEYIEDAKDLFLEHVSRESVIDAMLGWINGSRVAAFHGGINSLVTT
ncbi:MAG: hypothetical protein R3B84_18405 [Zavarzinella sp.]